MASFICEKCSHIYDEANGDPWFGINPNTRFEDLPNDWICCDCGSNKRSFVKITDQDEILNKFFRIIDIQISRKSLEN